MSLAEPSQSGRDACQVRRFVVQEDCGDDVPAFSQRRAPTTGHSSEPAHD
jgi:hypothetical protein